MSGSMDLQSKGQTRSKPRELDREMDVDADPTLHTFTGKNLDLERWLSGKASMVT